MTKIFVVFSLCFLSCLRSYKQKATDILQGAFQKCQSVRNGYIEAELFTKYPLGKDTVSTSVKGEFKKIKSDSIFPIAFHFDFNYQNHYNGSYLFTGKDFVEYFNYDSTATLLSGNLWPDRIKGYHTDKKIYMPITDEKSYPLPKPSDYIDGRHQFALVGKEEVNGQSCFHIRVNETSQRSETSEIKDLSQQFDYWIGKDSIPIQYIVTNLSADNLDSFFYYQKVVLKSYQLNTIYTDTIFKLTSVPSYFALKAYTPKKKLNLLAKNTIAPRWNIAKLNGDSVKLTDFKDKLIILDFFYKGCEPCMQAIPTLNNLYNKYKNRGLVVLGVDPFDSGEKEDLKRFVDKRKIQYPVLLDDYERSGSVDQLYSVEFYPTLYIIDKKGKIIHAQQGYHDGMELSLDNIIKHNLSHQ